MKDFMWKCLFSSFIPSLSPVNDYTPVPQFITLLSVSPPGLCCSCLPSGGRWQGSSGRQGLLATLSADDVTLRGDGKY